MNNASARICMCEYEKIVVGTLEIFRFKMSAGSKARPQQFYWLLGQALENAWDRPALGTGPSNAWDRPALRTGALRTGAHLGIIRNFTDPQNEVCWHERSPPAPIMKRVTTCETIIAERFSNNRFAKRNCHDLVTLPDEMLPAWTDGLKILQWS